MYLGRIVEEAPTEQLFRSPLHPYTRGLLQSIPKLDGDRNEKLHVIEGTVPSLFDIPRGCGFSTRCPYADEKCRNEDPVMLQADERHRVRCWHYAEIDAMEERRNGDGEAVGG